VATNIASCDVGLLSAAAHHRLNNRCIEVSSSAAELASDAPPSLARKCVGSGTTFAARAGVVVHSGPRDPGAYPHPRRVVSRRYLATAVAR
jgi:hypothetical protein